MEQRVLIRWLLLLTGLLGVGCGQDREQSTNGANLEGTVQEYVADDESVRLLKYNLTSEEINGQIDDFRETDLAPIPGDYANYNVTLFKFDNFPKAEDTVFVAPKVYAYGGQDKARISPKHNGDGTVTLDFPIILVSGFSETVPGPSGDESIQVPDTFLIKDKNSLLKRIGSLGATNLSPLEGCPKQVIFKVSNREYDATPIDFRSGEFCQREAPFIASVTMPEADARHLLEQDLYNHNVSVRVRFETRTRIAMAKYKMEFDKVKVFESLKAKFEVNHPYVMAEARTEVTKVMKQYGMKINMVGDINSQMETITSKAIDLFFEPMTPSPEHKKFKSCQSAVCIGLSYNKLTHNEDFSVEWQHSENQLTGQHYLTWAKLKPMDDMVRIGLKDGSRKLLYRGQSIETGLTVEPGDLLVISPEYLEVERRWQLSPQKVRRNNNVCVKWVEDRTFHNSMIEIPPRSYCVKRENRWIDTTTYSLSQPTLDQIDNPVGQFEQLYEGLQLRFTWANAEGVLQDRTCPLNVFDREGSGQFLTVRLNNTAKCTIFEEGANQPMLHIKNNIDFSITYKAGQLITNWQGQTTSRPVEKAYTPKVGFAGSLMIKGYSLSSGQNISKIELN